MSAPIGFTCPKIDAIKDSIIEIIKEMESISVEDSDLSSTIEYWRQSLVSIGHGNYCEIEEIRSANGILRDWGTDLENELEELKTEKYQLENKIEDLESQLIEWSDPK